MTNQPCNSIPDNKKLIEFSPDQSMQTVIIEPKQQSSGTISEKSHGSSQQSHHSQAQGSQVELLLFFNRTSTKKANLSELL